MRLIVGMMGGSVFGSGRGEDENDPRDRSWSATYLQLDHMRKRRLRVVGRYSTDDADADGVDNDAGTH